MDKIQVAFFFITGFFISRLIIKTELPQLFVNYLLDKKHASLSKVLFYMVFLSSGFSFFIPNVITVLTLLPVINTIVEAFENHGIRKKTLPTMLTLAVMYGANIGGMGSITATPANGILVSFIAFNDVANSEGITFATWLLWGIPLVLILSVAAWIIITSVFRTWRLRDEHSSVKLSIAGVRNGNVKLTILLTLFYFVSSILFSVWMLNSDGNQLLPLIVTAFVTLVIVALLFYLPILNTITGKRGALLKIKDCYSNLPIKGFIFVGISIAVAAVLYLLDLQQPFAEWVENSIPKGISPLMFLFVLALLTSFSTEFLSNTAIQISLFVIIVPLSELVGFSAAEALIVITLSSTCAFMSPIATGVNGLAFGGVKNVSLSIMLISGFLMNILGAVLISFWVRYFVSLTL